MHLRTPTVAIVPVGHSSCCLLTDTLAGIAENVLIDVFDPDPLVGRRIRNCNVDQIERRSLILLHELAAPQEVRKKRLRTRMPGP